MAFEAYPPETFPLGSDSIKGQGDSKRSGRQNPRFSIIRTSANPQSENGHVHGGTICCLVSGQSKVLPTCQQNGLRRRQYRLRVQWAGLEIMSRAKELGLHCIMEQTAADQAYDEQLLADERKLWPDWESAVVTESDYRSMADRERQERTLADLIVCGSEYVRNSLAAVGEDVTRCSVVPYGFTSEATPPSRQPRQDTLKVLFAGTLCLRKGVQYLVKVASDTELTGAMQFRAVGPSLISREAESQVRAVIDWRGAVPRSEMRSHYEWADVLVLPTISEGSANVCYESLHAGLPVITTPNAGSVVRDGIEGFVIPIRNSEQLKERLLQLSQQPDLREAMGKAATERAKEFTWDKYATRLLDAIRGMNLS